MVLSKGLVISLGFSALSCTLLFLYFRNKFSTMERKVNVMFDLVQNYQPSEQYSMENMHSQNQSFENSNEEQNNGAWNENAVSEGELDNRIVVSEDESEDDDDSEEVSDSDSEDDEEIPKLHLAETDISLSEQDVKKISVSESPNIDSNVELEEVDSLDEIEDDDDDIDDVVPNTDDNTVNLDVKTNEESKDEETSENDDDDDTNDDNVKNINLDNDSDIDYTQLKVSELKAIAEAKGLTNYKSLKKTPLIDLIKSAE